MKITVKAKHIEIVVDEGGDSNYKTTIRYEDQNKQLQNTLKLMVDECLKLLKA